MSRTCFNLRVGLALLLVCLLGMASPPSSAAAAGNRPRAGDHQKLDRKLNDRSKQGGGTSRVIITLNPGWDDTADVKKLGGKFGRRLDLINGHVAEVSNAVLRKLADNPAIASIVWDRPTAGDMNYAAVTIGARAVQQDLGYSGAGVGVAVIDSGASAWHNDLTYDGTSTLVKTKNGLRVPMFVDFVNGRTAQYDDNGHGTHVAGIIAGNGYDSKGARAGIAPSAHIVSLKVLDANGRGVISDVIAAFDYAVANKAKYNIRIINLSVGASVTQSYRTDPLTLAAKRAVDAGIVVVTAAGNLGKNRLGQAQYGAITAPGNAPWVLTVGAYSHNGTVTRNDDTMAPYSSRGPSVFDYEAKPDLVAPGTGIVSLAVPSSTLYLNNAAFLLKGSLFSLTKPYLSLSGTSMAAPMVSGTVALMLQANPKLTPNLVKAILQYTAQVYPKYDTLTEGAGFLNAKGAVDLAKYFATAHAGQKYPTNKAWSRKVNWGSHRVGGGVIKPSAPAWKTSVVWGAAKDDDGDNIVWGTKCTGQCENVFWTASDDGDNIVWGTASSDGDNIVWGTYSDGFNIVWGTSTDGDNIVWGTDCAGANCENVVWGASVDGGLDGDNIVWGTASEDTPVPLFDDPDAPPVDLNGTLIDDIFGDTTVGTTSTSAVLGGITILGVL